MKKYLILLTVLCFVASLAFGVNAVDDAELFDDFAEAVLSANNVEQPEANVTQAELDAVVSRLSAIYNNGTPTTTVGTSTALVTRANTIKALYDVVNGKADLTVINTVNGMVDSTQDDAYFDACRAFMQAGIITGYDDYGTIGVNRNVKRYELALMVDRILEPAERVTKNYVLYSSDEPFYLIDNQLRTFMKNGQNALHGWQYDYTGAKEKTRDINVEEDRSNGTFINKLTDYFDDDDVSLSKFVQTQDTGIMVFEAIANITFGDTFHFEFYDIDGNQVLSSGWKDSVPYVGTKNGSKNGDINHKDGKENTIRIQIDLDDKVAKLWANNVYVGESAFTGANIAKVRMATDVAQTGTIEFMSVHMYKNYEVNDVFRLEAAGAAPSGYTSSGAAVATMATNPGNHKDNENLKITSGGYATKAVEKPVGGKIVFSAHVLANGSTGTLKLQTADGTVDLITAQNANGVWSINGTQVYTSKGNIWNQVRVEADLDEQKITLVRINGKKVAENIALNVKTDEITHIKLASTSGDVYFDDIKLYRTHDYDDYVPTPNPITPKNGYILSMSVCNLWREGNHFGWDVISPYPELEPITGFYDEGIPEAMDWEIKFLTEHGITNYALCWYPLNIKATAENPLKKSRMNEALHDGFFNAKYSDLMTFNLLFENSSYTDLTEFKEVVWPYMIEWYFKDPRYLTMPKKNSTTESEIVFNVYRIDSWIKMCGGSYTDSKTYNASGCSDVLKWMEDELKAANITDKNGKKITGIVFNFSGSMYHEEYGAHKAAGGENVILYAWGNNFEIAGTNSEQEYYAAKNAAGAKADGLNFVALPAAAFNDIGWRDVRTATMTGDEFKAMCDWYQSSAFTQYAYTTDSSVNAMNKFVQFDTWNEYGEGHYIYPTVSRSELDYVGTGYDYLDAIAESFCTDHDPSVDVIPTDTQKLRIGHLYPATGKYNIARQHYPDTVKDSPNLLTLAGGTLTQANMDDFMEVSGHGETGDDNGYWTYTSRNGFIVYTYYYYAWDSANNGVYMKNSKKSDGNIINFDDAQFSGVSASDVKYIRFRIKGSQDSVSYKLYFKNTDNTFDENKTATFSIGSSGEYLLDTSKIDNWTGELNGIRLDVQGSGISIYIQEISFLGEDPADAHTAITIDDTLYKPRDYSEIRNKNYGISESGTSHEIYIAAQQWQGLYQKLHIIYEYERATGKLKLETPNGTIIEFTEGSSTAYVNGAAKTLSRAVENFDGVPVIPLIFVLDNGFEAGTYTRSARAIDINIADKYKTVYAVENGDAESSTLAQFTGSQQSAGVTRVTAPGSGHGMAWKVAGNTLDGTGGSAYRNIEFGYDFEMGVTYTVTFDIYVESYGASGEQKPATSTGIGFAIRTPGYNGSPDLGVGSAGTVPTGSWQTVSYTFTVPAFVDSVQNGRIGIFMNPYNTNYGATFYIDNVVVS